MTNRVSIIFWIVLDLKEGRLFVTSAMVLCLGMVTAGMRI